MLWSYNDIWSWFLFKWFQMSQVHVSSRQTSVTPMVWPLNSALLRLSTSWNPLPAFSWNCGLVRATVGHTQTKGWPWKKTMEFEGFTRICFLWTHANDKIALIFQRVICFWCFLNILFSDSFPFWVFIGFLFLVCTSLSCVSCTLGVQNWKGRFRPQTSLSRIGMPIQPRRKTGFPHYCFFGVDIWLSEVISSS